MASIYLKVSTSKNAEERWKQKKKGGEIQKWKLLKWIDAQANSLLAVVKKRKKKFKVTDLQLAGIGTQQHEKSDKCHWHFRILCRTSVRLLRIQRHLTTETNAIWWTALFVSTSSDKECWTQLRIWYRSVKCSTVLRGSAAFTHVTTQGCHSSKWTVLYRSILQCLCVCTLFEEPTSVVNKRTFSFHRILIWCWTNHTRNPSWNFIES